MKENEVEFSQAAADKVTRARANLITGNPFFGTLALRLKMIQTMTVKCASTNGADFKYNPKVFEKCTAKEIETIIAQGVMHVGMLHHTRRGAREKGRWNAAADFSVNGILQSARFMMPPGTFVEPKYNGKASEEIYTMLPPDPPGGKGKGYSPDGDGTCEIEDSPAMASESQTKEEEAMWKVNVAEAAHAAKERGLLPAELQRLVDQLMTPVLPWKHILRRFMTEKTNDDFSWKRPNRRLIHLGTYLPSRISEGTGEIVVVIDTSGSIGPKELNEFGSEIAGIVAEVRPRKTHVIYCDAAVAHVDVFAPDDVLEFKAHGGGGTDFRPPFEYVEKNAIDPKCLVYLTDGYGQFPARPPEYPTLWAINNNDVVPPFGEHFILTVA